MVVGVGRAETHQKSRCPETHLSQMVGGSRGENMQLAGRRNHHHSLQVCLLVVVRAVCCSFHTKQ